ncbi:MULTISPECIES: phosphoribosyl-AMP cyclohydrolase [Halomonadaceae]|uniref:Phosphoribosyl-AMP cyclohydrolase n=1 Tax=Vreelandella piezotolerans TaxID=2609667 RepID=A0ABQ6X8H8_9GAMM|nr:MULTISPECIES: phosphoribosyl-AMP cyclohydrolase [Halomonas]KAE8438314.1 phosphoribosyl-AMP cyclohydrolase [Halomonas piezotolerans]MCG7575266.1 phosphoribosyl-AMP cyclohydrolase [Halomonas sp. MMH1-48]MCG7602328.1 phosphoribosyl-AMP cyclohydrolase [Halomonas sp. MM17-34]MCG7611914.1 phosphoribosyl-AMP cyclohydrolase [Halomonas sp. MM17-29]MCG7618795.1 phosphoribosyl-AMP cyclohydrolase [Halomonas sp. DSH1-27]
MSQLDSMTPKQFFKALESASPTDSLPPLATLLDAVQFNEDGLIPAIAQQHDTKEVLMMAWMNREALEETLTTQRVCYYSRSRQKLWRKGETSGQQQRLINAALDCDGDTLLVQVDQTGPACHTGRRSCFYVSLGADGAKITSEPMIDPAMLYGKKTP